MEPESSSLHSQDAISYLYAEPDQSSPRPLLYFFNIHFNIIFLSNRGFQSGLFTSAFPTKTLYAPLLSPIHVICHANFILDFIILTIFGKECRL
jgi:hypothetical protein